MAQVCREYRTRGLGRGKGHWDLSLPTVASTSLQLLVQTNICGIVILFTQNVWQIFISSKSDFPHLLVTHPAPSKLLSLGPIFTSIFEISLTWPNSVYCVSCFRFLCVWLICIHVCVFASFTSLCGQHLVSAVLLVSQNHPKQKVIMRSRSLLMWSPNIWRLFFWGRTLNWVKIFLKANFTTIKSKFLCQFFGQFPIKWVLVFERL